MSKVDLDLSKMTFLELARARASILEDMDDLDKEISAVNAEIVRRLEPIVESSFKEKGVQHGLTRFEYDGCKVAVEIRKSVKWNQDDLRALSNAMPPEVAARLFEVELSIPEKVIEAMARTDLSLYAQLNKARTVKYSAAALKQIEPPPATAIGETA